LKVISSTAPTSEYGRVQSSSFSEITTTSKPDA
jgi:hypothetical protein